MKTIQVKFYKAAIFLIFVIGIPAFLAGWVVAVNFSGVFETGYEMAFHDIKAALKESIKDGQPYFFMNGLKFFPENLKGCSGGRKTVRENEPLEKEKTMTAFRINYNTAGN